MWSDWLVVCDCSFSPSALWSPLSVPTFLLGFLLPWTWGLSSRLLQQSAATAPYLWCGVAPLSRCPCPRARGSSSRPSLCAVAAAALMHLEDRKSIWDTVLIYILIYMPFFEGRSWWFCKALVIQKEIFFSCCFSRDFAVASSNLHIRQQVMFLTASRKPSY